jgi:predicted Fe-Mo cluster-binding NifX family protein
MKIAVSSSGPGLDSMVDPRFGRCAYLVFVDTETMEFEAVANPNVSAGGGAGISTAQMVIDKGARAVVTGNVGPNAFGVLNQAGVSVYTGFTGTVKEAVEGLKAGGFNAASSPTVGGHFGMQQPPGSTAGPGGVGPFPGFPGTGMGPGWGGGGGRGRGFGRRGGGGRGRW